MVLCSAVAIGGPGGGEDLINGLAVAVGASEVGEVERLLEPEVRSREDDCFAAIVHFENADYFDYRHCDAYRLHASDNRLDCLSRRLDQIVYRIPGLHKCRVCLLV